MHIQGEKSHESMDNGRVVEFVGDFFLARDSPFPISIRCSITHIGEMPTLVPVSMVLLIQ